MSDTNQLKDRNVGVLMIYLITDVMFIFWYDFQLQLYSIVGSLPVIKHAILNFQPPIHRECDKYWTSYKSMRFTIRDQLIRCMRDRLTLLNETENSQNLIPISY